MNKAFRILLAVLLVQLSLQASAQEKKDLFNPVNYAVVSQTIAPNHPLALLHRSFAHPRNPAQRRCTPTRPRHYAMDKHQLAELSVY